MFRFIKSMVGLRPDPNGETTQSDNQLIKDAFSDDEELSEDELNSVANGLTINGLSGQTLNGLVDTEYESEQEWNEDWNALEETVDKYGKPLLEMDANSRSVKGVVTEVVANDMIVIDDCHRIKYEICFFGDICVGDLVNIETNGQNKVMVKPLRYKIMVGKITQWEEQYSRFIFGNHAFLRKTEETQHLRTGDVIKVIVIETRSNRYNWRAIPYTRLMNPELSNVDIHSYTKDLMEDKDNICISNNITFGDIRLDSTKKCLVWIKNKGITTQTLVSVDNEEGENQIKFLNFQQNYGQPSEPPFIIPALTDGYVELICEGKYCGDHSELIVFHFENGFKIGRFVGVTVRDNDRNDSPRKGKNRHKESTQLRRRMFGNDTWIVPGERVWRGNKHIYDKLEKYRIPEKLWRVLENNWSIDEVFPEFSQHLNKDNYRNKFHALLYLEECENQFNLKKYDMEDVALTREGRFLALQVPGLADGRPSLIVGDKVMAFDEQIVVEDKRMVFEGFIHEIKKDEILIRFNDTFHNEFKGGSYKVMFQMGRTIYRRCHHAIDLSPHMVEQVLFPNKIINKIPFKRIPIESINWFNNSLNIRQKLAVVGALRGESRPTPYIIFGPPGTGKTVTIVESILQVFDKIPESRVIACTSANSSADLIAAKLLESGRITEKDLIRVSAFHRVGLIPEAVKCVTQMAEEDEKKWLYHRVIVTTTSQAGAVYRHKISPSHFTHVFIDEAAQVTEPESLIPISMCVMAHGVVVLAGDHKQLGPVVMSSKAKTGRLDRSFMERLMNSCQPYGRDEKFEKYGYYNPKFVTKLVDNYRSDAHIMTLPSIMFYENELKFNVETDVKLLESLKFKTALNFVGIRGEDRQDPDSPSWYNPQEIISACSYLDRLYKAGVRPEDIGIITPYRKQVSKMRTHMHDMGLIECKVSTIEEFQGLEKRVIIVSMVRSKTQHLDHDMRYSLGFIHNSKRFNVAISRAMALLICIGDPHLLSADKSWLQLLDYCIKNESYFGCSYGEFKGKRTEVRNKIMGPKIKG